MFTAYLYDSPVGRIERRGRGIRFTYADTALQDETLHALSVSLPKRPEAYPNRQAGVYFRNVLPEQAYRRLVAAAANAMPDDNLALLGAIGGECPGAVSIWPEHRSPPDLSLYQSLSHADLRQLFTSSGSAALGGAVTRGRLSLPGVQQKIALLRQEDGGWSLPLNGAVTSHILKQSTEEFGDLLENELFCMALAAGVGLEVPRTGCVSRELRVLWVERFDRVPSAAPAGAPLRKLHQEDFCQVLQVEPERKYESDGGPGISACATVIRNYSSLPAKDLPRLTRWLGFNYLVGNEDAHAKNLAFLYTKDGLRLSPHYDLVSTEVYGNLDRRLAMKIGRSWDIRNVQHSDWKLLAARVGLPWDRVRVLLLDLVESVTSAAPGVMKRCAAEFGDADIYGRIRDVIGLRAEQLAREVALL